ncbi:MAG: hypothetical protein H6564_11685 [Lewinellaceae bacterium]|nr:hypothetical protein [Lewinellaceae bacterium]
MKPKVNLVIVTTLLFVLFQLLTQAQEAPLQLSAQYSRQLLYLKAQTTSGPVRFFANTTGGTFLMERALHHRALPMMVEESGNTFIELDAMLAAAQFPLTGKQHSLLVPYGEGELECDADGMLGQAWFGRYCWTLDYPQQEAWCYQPPLSPLEAHTVPLSFLENGQGGRITSFASLNIEVDGEAISLVLDTGARLLPTAAACEAMSDTAHTAMGISFIMESVFEEWHAAHPDWPVVEQAGQELGNARLIQVPQITVAGHTVGPVWFCSRPDSYYLTYFSRFTGQPVMGALGGSALQYFRLTLDYPNGLAKFEN